MKRSVSVLLGTDWGVEAATQQQVDCSCNVCEPRKVSHAAKDKIRQKVLNGAAEYYCAKNCGGTRKTGVGRFTDCKQIGKITVCGGCCAVIQPEWVISKAERQRLSSSGMSYECLVLRNLELQTGTEKK